MSDIRLGGWAVAEDGRSELYRRLAYLPTSEADDEPAHAVADAWSPPHPQAVPPPACLALRRSAAGLEPTRRGGEYYFPTLEPEPERAVFDRFRAANAAWWRLDIDLWVLRLKRYGVGDRHEQHTDMHPAGSARRKIAGTVQLSRPSEYDGGALVIHHWGRSYPMPTALGTVAVFPGWTVHEVAPVTRGERWVLLVNGYGPPLR